MNDVVCNKTKNDICLQQDSAFLSLTVYCHEVWPNVSKKRVRLAAEEGGSMSCRIGGPRRCTLFDQGTCCNTLFDQGACCNTLFDQGTGCNTLTEALVANHCLTKALVATLCLTKALVATLCLTKALVATLCLTKALVATLCLTKALVATLCLTKALFATLCVTKALVATLCLTKALVATLCLTKALVATVSSKAKQSLQPCLHAYYSEGKCEPNKTHTMGPPSLLKNREVTFTVNEESRSVHECVYDCE
ncbi:hypothetical protein DUNSADRAFT_7162 [Dunaliella salina]|uniref:Uncharacterized protein n=1 Tax=Dunaliella salina TaxID=3046 RepID=A0ABQ7GLW9_DUNSA|nr:hypothetical protein DUNSADRAFT_7162 [Dunaliella salina]|eukprot:KAF5835614.1 hypothetical protein DUNSADRAFT_7162 [Dunaliella salina]